MYNNLLEATNPKEVNGVYDILPVPLASVTGAFVILAKTGIQRQRSAWE